MHRTKILPADRFFARIDKFECECPNCGRLLFSDQRVPDAIERRRPNRRDIRVRKAAWDLVWNPLSQRLRCPWCDVPFLVGLLVFPVKHGARRPVQAPPDTIPTKRQLLELRRRAGGWLAKAPYVNGESVNLVIDNPCTCRENTWDTACPIHGVDPDPLQA